MKKLFVFLLCATLFLLLTACGKEEAAPPPLPEEPSVIAEEILIERDGRCALYLEVLGDLWEADSGLNGGITYLAFDFSETTLSETDALYIAETFAAAQGAQPLLGTMDTLLAEGYLTADENGRVTRWDEGLMISIAEKADGSFDAMKWRSSLGAYVFADCIAAEDLSGYTIGSEVIA